MLNFASTQMKSIVIRVPFVKLKEGTMKRKLIPTILWTFLGACLIVFPAFFSQTAGAQSDVESVTTYYSDTTHTTVVGTRTVFCNGDIVISGTVTNIKITQFFPCLINPKN